MFTSPGGHVTNVLTPCDELIKKCVMSLVIFADDNSAGCRLYGSG